VGGRLKQLRTRAGLTLEELCVASGVSRAMLSNVERGEKSPTLTILVRIAAGLGVSLSTLMGAEPTAPDATVTRGNRRLTFKDPETGFERQILSPNHVENGVELLLHCIPPGQSSGTLPPYNVPTEKLLVVHEGQLTVCIGDRRYDLKTGDSFYFEVREPYRFVNEGRTGCAYYLVIVQPRG
jgi:transcriptional regulator with XRE-family HTH domain